MRAEPMRDQLWTVFESPLGPLTLRGGPAGLRAVEFPGRGPRLDETRRRPDGFVAAREQLEAYFAGERTTFELALDVGGTAFLRGVWHELGRIPYGATVSYTELARSVGRPDRVRAVAAAVGRNPAPIVIPCHRVVGADGALTGYGGGLQRKAALLDLEARTAAGRPPEPAWAFRQLALL
jgi:methylated-DNA-[protein]-cysteine S-methyltransferase